MNIPKDKIYSNEESLLEQQEIKAGQSHEYGQYPIEDEEGYSYNSNEESEDMADYEEYGGSD